MNYELVSLGNHPLTHIISSFSTRPYFFSHYYIFASLVVLELGGKDPMIFCEDVKLEVR